MELIDQVAAPFLRDLQALTNHSMWTLPDITGITSLWAKEDFDAPPVSIAPTQRNLSVRPFLCHQREMCRRLQDVTSKNMSFHEVEDILSLLTSPPNVVAPVSWLRYVMGDLISDISDITAAVSRVKRAGSLSSKQILRVHLSGVELRCVTNCTHLLVRDLLKMDDAQLRCSLVDFVTLFAIVKTAPALTEMAITTALQALGRVKAKHSEARIYSLFVVGYLHRLASGQSPPASATPISAFVWRGLVEAIEAVAGAEDWLVASFRDMDWSLERTPLQLKVAVRQRLGMGYEGQNPANILLQHLKPQWDAMQAEFRDGELLRRLEIAKLGRWWMNLMVSGLVVALVGMLSAVPRNLVDSAKYVLSSLALSQEHSLYRIRMLCIAIHSVRELAYDDCIPEAIRDLLDCLPYDGMTVLHPNPYESVPMVACLEEFSHFLSGLKSTHMRQAFGLALMAIYQRSWRNDFHYPEVVSFLVKWAATSRRLPFDISVTMAPLITQGVGDGVNISETTRLDLQLFLETCKTVSYEDRWEPFLEPDYLDILTRPFRDRMPALLIAARALKLLHDPDPLLVKCYDMICQVFTACKPFDMIKMARSSIQRTHTALERLKDKDASVDKIRSSILRNYLLTNVQTLSPFIQRYLDIRSSDGSFHLELPEKTQKAKTKKPTKKTAKTLRKDHRTTCTAHLEPNLEPNLEPELEEDTEIPALCGPALCGPALCGPALCGPAVLRLSRCVLEAKNVSCMGEIQLCRASYT